MTDDPGMDNIEKALRSEIGRTSKLLHNAGLPIPEIPKIQDPAFLRSFQEYKDKNPEFFPGDYPIEKQYAYFSGILDKQNKARQGKEESFQKLDAAVEEKKEQTEISRAAEQIYRNGKFLQYCRDCFSKVWYGDLHILEGILYTAGNMRVLNAVDGIHISVLGNTQSGKSDSIKSALRFIHPDNKMVQTFSTKALFYAPLQEGTIIFSDDTILDPETAALYRNMLTSWNTGISRVVVVFFKATTLTIPPRVSLVLTSVEGIVAETVDGQDESRFLTLEVRRTPEQMRRIRDFVQEPHPDISDSLNVVYAIWNMIIPKEVTLHKTVDKDLPIRELKRYLTLVQTHALLCNRDITIDEDYEVIDKFLTYSKPMIDNTTPAFTRKEAAVMSCLSDKWLSVSDICEKTGMSILNVYRAIRGRNGTFINPKGGLMEKEPRLQHMEERLTDQNNIHSFKLKNGDYPKKSG